MANFQNNALTDSGRVLLSHVQMGAVFTPTKIVIGSGAMPVGKIPKTMTDVAEPVVELKINKKQRTNDGKAIIGGMYSNQDIEADWYYRELALYAKAVYADGTEITEILYCYGNAGDTADLMPAYTSGQPVERQIDIVTYIGSDANVDLTIETGAYVTVEMLERLVTPDMIGAAPAGFGLGGNAVKVDSWNNAKANGYYYSNVDAPDALTWYGHTVVSSGNDALVQTVYSNINGLVHRCVRRCLGGVFGEWEWDNPTFSGGTEYRTTERFEGKAVYKRRNQNGYIEYRLDGETTWKNYAGIVGAVSKDGGNVNGSLNIYGALSVMRADTERNIRAVVHDNAAKEVDFQNYVSDDNYVALRVATEATGAGDAVKVAHMKGGSFAAYTVLHTGNKEKIFTFGTDDLTPGSSPLGTGQLHFVYE